MKNHLLLQTLEKLSKKEWTQLEQYLKSPFFQVSTNQVRLLAYLKSSDFSTNPFNKIDLFKQIFGSKTPYNDHKVRLLMSELLKSIEGFIGHQKELGIKGQVQLAKFYRKNGLEKHFNRIHRKATNQLEQSPYRNHEYFTDKNLLDWEQFEMTSSKKRDVGVNLQELGQNFDIAYFSAKLRQACFLRAQQAFYAIEYDFDWVEQIIAFIQQKDWQKIPAIALYYTAYQLSIKPNAEPSFQNLKQQILEYGDLFPPEEIQDIYLLAINFCIKKMNNGEQAYIKENLNLYKKGLEIGCFLDKGNLSKFTFANIVALGLITKDFEWTEHFIQTYKNKLHKSFRNSTYSLNMARLTYVKDKNYDAALSYLQKVSDKDLLNTLNAKILQLRIYWETKAFSLLESHLEAMANFIRRRAIIGYHKENFLNIIKYTKRLLKVNFYDKSAVKNLKAAIQNEKVISEKKWLIEQLNPSATEK